MIRILMLLLVWGSFVSQISAQEVRFSNEKMMLSDGVKLSTDIYLPEAEGSYPVVMIRTPYGKFQMDFYGEFFAKNGYAVVVQDVRGEYESEGEFYPFINEKKDGLEVLDWIAGQPWCNGDIAGFGTSYIGFTALTLMDEQHPNLKAVFNISGWIQSEKMNNPGGALHLMLGLPWLLHEATLRTGKSAQQDLDSLYKVIPVKNAMRVAGMETTLWEQPGTFEQLNADYDFSRVNVPVFHITGWYDFVAEGTLQNYLEIKKHADVPQKLIVGPWFHNQEHTKLTEVGDEDFGEVSYLGDAKIMELARRWFDHWLRGEDNGIMDEPEVKLFNMFANEWQTFETFPPKNAEATAFYLSSQRGANSLHGDGTLSANPPKATGTDRFTYNPLDPVPTYGGANFHFFPEFLGVKDQRDIEAREDVLVYTSESFAEARDVVGKVHVRLFAATEGADTDFTAKLVLVDDYGYARNICDGIIRARHRNDLNKSELLKPGKVYEFEIDLGHTAFQIQPGQRIRLEVSSSNFPKFNRNLNVATDPFEATEIKVVEQTIYHSKQRPSQLILPILKP